MNIYVTDINPDKCAQALDDFTLTESLVYTASALCSACSLLGMWNAGMHPAIRTAHPIPQWMSRSKNNFRWAYRYGQALAKEHRYRFGREHSEEKFLRTCWASFNDHPHRPLQTEMTPFYNLTPYSDRRTDECYREMLCNRIWNITSVWTKRGRPDWFYPPSRTAA